MVLLAQEYQVTDVIGATLTAIQDVVYLHPRSPAPTPSTVATISVSYLTSQVARESRLLVGFTRNDLGGLNGVQRRWISMVRTGVPKRYFDHDISRIIVTADATSQL